MGCDCVKVAQKRTMRPDQQKCRCATGKEMTDFVQDSTRTYLVRKHKFGFHKTLQLILNLIKFYFAIVPQHMLSDGQETRRLWRFGYSF